MTGRPKQGLLPQAAAAARRMTGFQRDGVHLAPDATLLIRPDGTIADLNHYAETVFGYRREDLLGQNLSALIPERFRKAHANHFTAYRGDARPRGMGSGMDLWGLRKDGSEFPVDIALRPRQTPEGVQILCSVRDLSARLLRTVEKQLAFEKLATDISARFARMPVEKVDDDILGSLRQIVEFLGVDRSSFGEFSFEQGTLTVTHSYAVPGIPALPRLILDHQFPWYSASLRRGEVVRMERLPDDLPAEALAEREYSRAQGFKANLTIPLKVGGSVAYVIAVGSFRSCRKWSDELVQRLQLLGEIFASTLMHKRTLDALQESEAKFRLLAETATCGIAIYQDDRFQYVSPQATEITGYTRDEISSMSVEQLLHPDSRAAVLERAQRRLRGELIPARYEIKILTKRGEERWVDFTAAVTQYKGRPAIIGTAFDVTQRRQAEEALHELSGRLIRAQEDERSRVARELHDDLSQRLALLAIGLEQAGQRVAESTPEEAAALQSLWEQTREIGTDLHRLSRQLHPSQLEALGLVSALRGFCTEFSKQKGLRIEFAHDGILREIPDDVTLCLYRIVQESVQNASQHGRARRVDINLVGAPEAIHLAVVDDGVGFDVAAQAGSPGLGLVSMRERARLAHGDFAVGSEPNQGTRIDVRIPLAGHVR